MTFYTSIKTKIIASIIRKKYWISINYQQQQNEEVLSAHKTLLDFQHMSNRSNNSFPLREREREKKIKSTEEKNTVTK